MSKKRSLTVGGLEVFWYGLLVFVVGSGPLLTTIAMANLGLTSDPNPNPVLFGIMAMFTFWPSLIMMLIGLGFAFAGSKRGSGGEGM